MIKELFQEDGQNIAIRLVYLEVVCFMRTHKDRRDGNQKMLMAGSQILSFR